MASNKLQNVFSYLILLGPITLFFFIKWYWVLLVYNILFSIFGYIIWKANKKKHFGLFKAIVFPLLFNVMGLLYLVYIGFPDEEEKEKKIDDEEVEKNLAMNVAKILAMNPNSECRINFSFNEEWKSCYYQYKTNSKLNPNDLPTLDEKYLGDTGEPLLNDNNQEVYDPSQKIEYKTYFEVKQKEVYTSKSIISLLQEKIKEKLESGELSKNSNQEEMLQSLDVYDICPESSVLLFKAIGCSDYKKLESKNEYDNILWCTSTQLDEEYVIFSLEEITELNFRLEGQAEYYPNGEEAFCYKLYEGDYKGDDFNDFMHIKSWMFYKGEFDETETICDELWEKFDGNIEIEGTNICEYFNDMNEVIKFVAKDAKSRFPENKNWNL